MPAVEHPEIQGIRAESDVLRRSDVRRAGIVEQSVIEIRSVIDLCDIAATFYRGAVGGSRAKVR